MHELKRTLWAAGPTGQYLYINIWRTLPGIVVVQGHHSPCGHWMLTRPSSVPLCGREKRQKKRNEFKAPTLWAMFADGYNEKITSLPSFFLNYNFKYDGTKYQHFSLRDGNLKFLMSQMLRSCFHIFIHFCGLLDVPKPWNISLCQTKWTQSWNRVFGRCF